MSDSKRVSIVVRFTGARGGRNEKYVTDALLYACPGGIKIESASANIHYAQCKIVEVLARNVHGRMTRRGLFVTWPDGPPSIWEAA